MRISVRFRSIAPLACMAWLSLGLIGCGGATDDLSREPISGMVTLDGQPLATGVIQFFPASAKEGVTGGAVIKDGKFEIERAKGLVPGEYRVVINSAKDGGSAPPADGPPGPTNPTDGPKELIPAKYNDMSKLVAEVKSGGSEPFNFSLQSK